MKKLIILLLASVFIFAACSDGNIKPTQTPGSNTTTDGTENSGGSAGSGEENGGSEGSGGEVTGNFLQTGYQKIGTQKINGTDYDIVTFGNWPQSLKADTVTVSSTTTNINGFVCYKGSDNGWYVKHGETGNEEYFKLEPIKWRVLTTNYDHDGKSNTEGKKLLLAEDILIACRYYGYNNINRTIASKTIYPNNYEHSGIRAYLNGLSYEIKVSFSVAQETDSSYLNKGFLQSAFTAEEIAAIADTDVNNTKESLVDADGKMSTSDTYVCPNTKDKIFLLSENEVTTLAYGFAENDASGVGNTRIRMTTAFARANGAGQNSTTGLGGFWWLRSPFYGDDSRALYVDHEGLSYRPSFLDLNLNGVVPALCLN